MTARSRTTMAGAAGLLSLLLTACSGYDGEPPREGTRVEELTDDTSGDFDLNTAEAGQEASLRATVEAVLSTDSFVISSEDTAAAPLLVLSTGEDVAVGDVLQIGGTLRVFSYDEVAGEHELAEEGVYADFDNGLVLVADVVDEDLPLDGQ